MAEEAYTWGVVYKDDTILDEKDAQQGFGSVEQSRIERVFLFANNLERVHSVLVPDGAQGVFFRRRSVSINPTGGEQSVATVHCIGWQRDEAHGVYLFIAEDGKTLLTSNLQAV